MSIESDLRDRIASIATSDWVVTPGRVVPDVTGLPFANQGKTLDACFLYADLSDSTGLVNRTPAKRAAEYYKAFLHCASKLIEANNGTIEAYDGDRVMGVFLGEGKENNAVVAAFQLKRAMLTIVNPEFLRAYGGVHSLLRYTVGIDTGEVLACKAGVRGNSELVWIGPAANYAAKLNSFPDLDHAYETRITASVLAKLPPYFFPDGSGIWTGPFNDLGIVHYRTKANIEFA
ncbi:adenylate/guanylate cyclase domain-containing protein [Stenotrophomonas maltophilia]|uniref:adenylate/guanylate cyclase domain-containing protein n=1 Tax=Stenotrophomonas maltophilia TaxID=40324 RepID=UPI000DA81A10|nr:adenylate/guanylate cyclase domain-containing protein [Stenotrophomonas maltophilia]MBH1690923.1 adenylate/guanylate cyclase domain-containing protein [Stenotrophomonas maltophilia]MBH1708489.1 adenylate/guanylate cyclase domain-containing protein [Stenotrophomonas maltophilia]MBH1848436.1 adenylate/guanylate cyclase domain-containing protein [Stenotrophomonas maltophilia]NYB77664.1 adenylate/guanylate cyclase domain-containing protein [Stenotrophomonas maltophilia]